MAERVEGDPFKRAPRHNQSYPWDEWLDGGAWLLTQGPDFKKPARSMQTHVLSMAKKRGGRAQTQIRADGTSLYIKFIPKEETP